jgi:hypothetical protein
MKRVRRVKQDPQVMAIHFLRIAKIFSDPAIKIDPSVLDSGSRGRQASSMQVFATARPWNPAGAAPPLTVVSHDWHGELLRSAAAFALVVDPACLWFVACFTGEPAVHPDVSAGAFHEGLWHHDVAELFIVGADGDLYLEFNLSPAGAWWACSFDSPRVRSQDQAIPRDQIRTYCTAVGHGATHVAMALPLDWLQSRIGALAKSRANVSMILGSPNPQFVTTADLGGGEPDFHRPQRYPRLNISPLSPGCGASRHTGEL